MSVPLDRLYNFLQAVCNQDILIYRWIPHGSRKLEDLEPLNYFDRESMAPDFLITVQPMICHDQEPLKYDYWTIEDFEAYPSDFPAITKQIAPWHLRSVLKSRNKGHVFGKTLLCHSELHSKELAKYENNDFAGVYYWSHALIARDWYRHAAIDPLLGHKQVNRDFLIYNRAWSGTREYRLKFLELILQQNLLSDCNIKFNPVDGYHYKTHKFVNLNLAIDSYTLEDHVPPNLASAAESADYNSSDYNSTAVEIVLETLFDDSRWHLTEKTLRPIACAQPFILAATPGSLRYLKSYGFETFDSVFDESYDQIQDPLQRLQAIVDLMATLSEHPKKIELFDQCRRIAKRNQQRFFSLDFHQQVVSEFKQNFDQAYLASRKQCSTEKIEQWFLALEQAKNAGNQYPPAVLAEAEHIKSYIFNFVEKTKNELNNLSNPLVVDFVDKQ